MNYYQYLVCPTCQGSLRKKKTALGCTQCDKTYPVHDGIVCFETNNDVDFRHSFQAWDSMYRKQWKLGTYKRDSVEYRSNFFEDTYRQLTAVKLFANSVYLEIGCGPFYLGQGIARKCKVIIGIDISFSALKIAKKMLDKQGTKNYLLIQGDIRKMPIKTKSVDIIYGGGVIEHFRETQSCVNELYRVLRRGGISLNSVPMCNIGSLTYRQVWGNIPNVIFLRPLAEFVHIQILQGKHMKFGYELSFTRSTLEHIHRAAGFRNVRISRFDAKLFFEFLPEFLRPVSRFLGVNSSLFWPMIKAVAVKT